MESVIIDYPEARKVRRAGTLFGLTQQVLQVRAGLHTFDLGDPPDYTPRSQRVDVRGTSPLSPMHISFQPLAAPVAPPVPPAPVTLPVPPPPVLMAPPPAAAAPRGLRKAAKKQAAPTRTKKAVARKKTSARKKTTAGKKTAASKRTAASKKTAARSARTRKPKSATRTARR